MKIYLTSLILLFAPSILLAQNNQQVSITGTVFDDSTKEPVEQASIRVLNAKDSSYVNGTATNAGGKFRIQVKPGNYIIDISFLGYTNNRINVNATKAQNVLGDIFLKDDGILLSEATVVAKAPEIVVKGDTVEYNADSYKVQESAVLEDLIKKIPGAEIDADGKIKVNGKDISKILVDGKEFFSDDPKTASQNLPAKIVEKLQVLDKKSDMAQITGFDDGEEETVINLVVKPGMKQGLYGNALVGYGTKDRYEGNGFLNYARNNTRISVLGNINNTNNENSNSRSSGRGVTDTKEAGFNFATDFSDKLKWDGDVYYSYTDNDVNSTSNRQYTAIDRFENSSSVQTNKNDVLNMRQRLEWSPDSLTKVIFRPNLRYTNNRKNSLSESSITDNVEPLNNILTNKNGRSKSNNFNLSGDLLVSRKLNNNGRSLTLQFSGGFSNGDGDGYDYSNTEYQNKDSIVLLDQRYDQDDKSNNWRLRLSYLEPVGHNNFLELAYNIRKQNSETDKKTYDYDELTGGYTSVAEDYTRNTKNDFLNQNISLSFQSRRQKYNYTVGLGLEPSSSKTTIEQPNLDEKVIPRKNFLNLAPRVEFNYLWDKRHNLRVRYNTRTNQPTTLQLYDGIITQDGLNKTIGNPGLKPSFQNMVFIRYQKYTPEKASSLMMFARFFHVSNAIVNVSKWEGAGRTSTYENINGNMEGNFRVMYNTPLKNKKFSINTSTYGSYTRDNTFISDRKSADINKNTADVYNIGEDLRLKFNSDVFQFDLGGRISYESTHNSLSKDKNQNIYNYGGFGNFTWYLPFDFALESDLNYSSNSGYSSGFQQNEWLWNASLSKQILKAKNATIRIKIYDILQDRSNISRTSSAEYIQDTFYNTINSYVMVNFIYRFQSFKGGAKRSDMDGSERRGPGPGGYGGGRGGRPPGM